MFKSYPIFFKLMTAILLAFLAFIVPILSIKIIISIISVIFFVLCLRKFGIFFAVMVILFFIIPASIFMLFSFRNFPNQMPWNMHRQYNIPNVPGFNNFWNNFNWNDSTNASPSKIYKPNKYINREKELIINGINLQITFNENSDQIHIPDEFKIKKRDDSIEIDFYTNNHNDKIIIEIGTKYGYENLIINSTVLNLNGNIIAENIELYSIGTFYFSGKMFAENVLINTTSSKTEGTFDVINLSMNSTAMTTKIDLINTESFNVNGTSINLDIKYLGEWTKKRNFNISCTVGDITINIPKNSSDKLEVKYRGRVNFKKIIY